MDNVTLLRKPIHEPLRKRGCGRELGAPREAAITWYFNRRPTDEEMRFLDDCMGRSVHLVPKSE